MKVTNQFAFDIQRATGSASVPGFYLTSLLLSTQQGTPYDPSDSRNILYRADDTIGSLGVPVLEPGLARLLLGISVLALRRRRVILN